MIFLLALVLLGATLLGYIYAKVFPLFCAVGDLTGGNVLGGANYMLCQIGANANLMFPVSAFALSWAMTRNPLLALAVAVITALVLNFMIVI